MALACLVVFGSCKKNENENNNSTNENGTLSAGIVQPNNGAKTSITIDGNQGIIKWTEGDQILVGDVSQSGTFTLLEGAGASTAVFRCPEFPVDELDYYTAAYPASAATVSGTAVTFNIPAEQTLTRIEDGFGNGANPMVAYATAPLGQLEFKSVFGGVGIKLQAPVPASITKLVLTDNNNYLCGQFSVADVTVDDPSATHVSGGGHSITLNLPAGGLRVDNEGCNVYIMLPVGALSNGFTLDAYCGDNLIKTASTTSTEAVITVNQINNAVKYEVELPAGQASTPEAVQALASDPNVTTITVLEGAYDFENAVLPANKQIAIAEGAEVEISNLSASTTTAQPAMVINSGANATLSNVTLTSTSTASNSRAINIAGATDTGEGINVTLNNCNIDGGNAGYSRGLNVYSDGEAVEVNVVGGTIHAGHYAVNIPTSQNVTINLTDASVASGWAALNLWGSNNTINATNCTLKGSNDKTYNADGWNDFATIAFNNNNVNNTVNLVGTHVIAESTTGNKQFIIRMYTGGNTISVDNACTISKGIGNTTTPNWYAYYGGSDSTGSHWNIDEALFESFNAVWGGSKGANGKPVPAQVSASSNESSAK
jgi:hypothetical protein